jgi:flagellar protein FlaG
LTRITEALQKRTAVTAPELEFSVDQSSGRSIVKIVERATKDVILQIPSEEMLRIGKALDQYQQGLLIDRKV